MSEGNPTSYGGHAKCKDPRDPYLSGWNDGPSGRLGMLPKLCPKIPASLGLEHGTHR
jgi:hypothetical protein